MLGSIPGLINSRVPIITEFVVLYVTDCGSE